MTDTTRRRILAAAAMVFLLAAVVLWLWRPDWEIELAFFSRMGAVLLAAWLAYDDIQRLPGWLLIVLPVVLVIVVRWPRYFMLLLPVLIGWAVLRRLLSPGPR